MKTKLLILMVSFQRKEYTLGNVLNISKVMPENSKFIICDNGSTDGTREWLEENKDKYGYELILTTSNLRVGGAWKLIANNFEKDDFDYVLLLDNDHWLIPNINWFQECLEIFNIDEKITSLGLLGRRKPGWCGNETIYDKNYEKRKLYKNQEYYNTDLYAGCRLDKFNLWRQTFSKWSNRFIANNLNLKYHKQSYKTYKLNPGYCIDISQYNFNNPNHKNYNEWFFNIEDRPNEVYDKKMNRSVTDYETKKLIIDKFGDDVYNLFISQ